ncbi:hypothetical protein ACJDU8_00260 [Clostridium sp. WILCCON 0269]|uniref:Uncharacterized protein n=1 Tax=Candidatus Clostridium eludens TaxID=3381663 RepID=A0ABW8SE82_9CLOT
MRIYIRLNNGKSFKIPAPIGLIKAALSLGSFGVSAARRFIPENQRQYIDCINFRELKTSFDVLKNYKGLKIVEIKSKDQTEVTIII